MAPHHTMKRKTKAKSYSKNCHFLIMKIRKHCQATTDLILMRESQHEHSSFLIRTGEEEQKDQNTGEEIAGVIKPFTCLSD